LLIVPTVYLSSDKLWVGFIVWLLWNIGSHIGEPSNRVRVITK
jgi:hypothetical protein